MDMQRFEKMLREYAPLEKCGIKKEAGYTLGADFAKKFNLEPGDDLISIVSGLGGKICYLDMSEYAGMDGSIFLHDLNNFEIILPAYTGPLRDRFTIAHELAHYILHYAMSDSPREKCCATRSGSGPIEWEANWFAAGFLMPEEEFKKLMRVGFDTAELAACFGVSQKAAEIRKRTLQ